jgi:hypothetical protein
MAGTIQFNRTYIDFGPQVNAWEKTPDILSAIETFFGLWGYDPMEQLGAKVTAQWLGEGEKPANQNEAVDLIFEIKGQPFFEIVLNTPGKDAVYGGYLYGTQPVEITDEIVNGYRVLVTKGEDGANVRHEFDPAQGWYLPVAAASAVPLNAARRMLRKAS